MHFAVRVAYPEKNEYNWTDAVKAYVEVGRVEAAFYSTELFISNVRAEDVLAPFEKYPVKATSVHMAHVNITDFPLFEIVLKRTIEIAKLLNCQHIVVHPSKGDFEAAKAFIDEQIEKILNHEKMYLCWETFTSKKRFLSGIHAIAEFCHGRQWHKACYDFSHIHDSEEDVLKQVSKYIDCIKIFHISNRISEQKIQHLPIFHKGAGKLDLDFVPILKLLKDKGYYGTLVLEYLQEFHDQLACDALSLMQKYG